jgi:predicted peptidase
MLLVTAGLLALTVMAADPSDATVAQYEPQIYKVPDADPPRQSQYRLLKPEKLEPGKRYPIVLFLHGAGERGDDNKKQLLYLPEWMAQSDWRERYPCFLMAPQCPKEKGWSGPRLGQPVEQSAEPATEAEVALMALLALKGTLPIDDKRIYLTGLSMGGYGSWQLAAHHPNLFAAVVPICGGGQTAWAAQLKDVPIWAVHGDADTVVPPSKSRDMIEAIKAAGGNPKYTELPGVGHNSWTPAYEDPHGVLEWMFQQHK